MPLEAHTRLIKNGYVSKSQYRMASDSYLARVSGSWAQEKLKVLQRYNAVVATAMKNSSWIGLAYVDLLAGGGRCILETGEEFEGSPLIALRCSPPFSAAVFVEQHPKLVEALKARTADCQSPIPTIIEGDCNDGAVIAAIRKAVPATTLSVAFVDNLGWEVSLSTISRIVANRRMDLVVTFQVGALKRNVSRALTDANVGAQWDGFLGRGWRKVVEDFEARRIQAPDVGAALGDFYADQLMKLGYKFSCSLNDTMRNTKNAPLYRVMSFSKHPLGQKLFRAVSKSVDDPSFDF